MTHNHMVQPAIEEIHDLLKNRSYHMRQLHIGLKDLKEGSLVLSYELLKELLRLLLVTYHQANLVRVKVSTAMSGSAAYLCLASGRLASLPVLVGDGVLLGCLGLSSLRTSWLPMPPAPPVMRMFAPSNFLMWSSDGS